MDWKDILKKITDVLPAAGAFFGAPGIAIGTAIKALGAAFGLGDDAKPEDIIKSLGNPEAQIKLIAAQNAYNLEILKNETENVRLQLADVQSARMRQIESEKATGGRDVNLYVLAWTIVIGFFLLMIFLLKVPVPIDQSGVIFMLFGALASGFGQVLQYFFGSSQGSVQKTQLLSKAPAIKE